MISTQLVFCFLILCSSTLSSSIHGPIVTNVGASATYIEISANSEIIVMSFYPLKDIEVYQNSGEGFNFKESLNDTSSCYDFALSTSGRLLAVGKHFKCLYMNSMEMEVIKKFR